MKQRNDSAMDYGELTDHAVEQYLKNNPDYFERHPGLLAQMRIPHHINGAVSLIERQVGLLRNRNGQLEGKIEELVQVAWENEGLSSCLHKLALKLIAAKSLDDVFVVTLALLRDGFPSTHAVIRLLDDNGKDSKKAQLPWAGLEPGTVELFEELFVNDRPVCGCLNEQQMAIMFAGCDVNIASAVLIPLQDARRFGVMALGTEEEDHFRDDLDTLFLHSLGELISCALKSHQ
jgi:uncharacterized protein YigA (DUF484 family)